MLDIILLIALLYGAIRGYMNGFVVQSLTLVALVAGIWIGLKFNPVFSGFLEKTFSLGSNLAPYISFAILFLAVIILIHFIGVLITKILDKTVLGGLNKLGGVIFGILKMAFILSVIIFLVEKFDTSQKIKTSATVASSKLYSPIAKIAPTVFPHINFENIKNKILQ